MKKLLLAAGALILASLIAVLYVWLETNEARPASSSAPAMEGRVALPAGEPEPLAGDQTPPAAATPADIGAVVPAPELRRDADEREPAEVTAVRGTVRIPSGTPGDEQLEVLAFANGNQAEHRASDHSERKLAAVGDLIARTPVGRDGGFQIDVPADYVRVWIALRGRYLYADKSITLESSRFDQPLSIEAQLGAWVTGTVRLPAGANPSELDLDDTEVELQFDHLQANNFGVGRGQPSRLREYETTCADDLSFEFRGVAVETEYDVRIRPEHFAAHKTAKTRIAPGAHVVIDVALQHGGSLTGRVVDASGKVVEKAAVGASIDPVAWGQGGFPVRRGETDAAGAYQLAAVIPGRVDLVVKAEGYLDGKLSATVVDRQATALADVVLQRGESIAGRVTWEDGTPAAEVEVEVEFDPAALGGMSAFNAFQGADGDGKTGADGHFEVAGLGKGPFVVMVEERPADAVQGSKSWRAKESGVKPGTKGLELVLRAPLSISGRVVDRAGAPVAAFEVAAREQVGGIIPGLGGHVETLKVEHAEGLFELSGLAPGRWKVDALAQGYTRSESVDVTLPPAAEATPIELVLARGAQVSGIVLSAGGVPVSGAQVSLKLSMQEMLKFRGQDGAEPPHTLSDSEGKFVLRELGAGRLALVATADDSAESEPASVELAPEQTLDGITLRLRLGGRITGEVFGKTGAPLAGAQIMAQQTTDQLHPRFAHADSEGHFAFDHLVPGSWNVMHLPMDRMQTTPDDGASAADFTEMFSDMKLTSAEVKDGEEVHVLLGAPPKNPVQVSGRIHAGDKGVASAVVTFLADGGKGIDSLKFTTTDSEGRYSVQLGAPGGYVVSVQKVGMAGEQQTVAHTVEVPERPEFVHDVALPLGTISGSVRDPEGKPARGERVNLTVDGAVPNASLLGEHYAEITTDDGGRYELLWLKPGRYTVSVGGLAFGGMFGDGGASSGRQMRPGIEVREGEAVDGVDFKLHKPGRVEGLVRGSDGKPLPEAAIFLRDAAGRVLERFSMVTSDATGRFAYDGLDPGEYTVLARTASETSSESALVRVKEAATTEVELTLAAGTILLVTLTDDDGTPIQCSVSVTDEQGRQVNGMMSLSEIMQAFSQGRFSSKEQRVGPLPPGKYRVQVTTNDGRSTNKPVVLTGQAERKLNIRF